MSVADQPSILTICLMDEATDPSRDAIKDVLAMRAESLTGNRGGEFKSGAGDPEGAQAVQTVSCDDSAFGMDTSGLNSGTIDTSTLNTGAVNTGTMDLGTGNTGDLNGKTGSTVDDLRSGTAGRVAGTGQTTASFFHADSGKKALELLRVLRFDLLVTGDQLPDMSVSQLVRRVRAAWPWQKWAMVGTEITTQDEITARSLGAIAVFDTPADWHVLAEMAESIRSRAATSAATAIANTASGTFGAFAGVPDRNGRRGRRVRTFARQTSGPIRE